jgi:hypothetical protein
MPINKDVSVSPFFDDHDPQKNYHRVLFKPSVAVQVRELNELQSILQEQVERFGNNIYKRGTIIDGVNFIYHPNYAYIKITDSQLDGQPAEPELYVSHFVVDPTSNLTAHIINWKDGFESTDPDLKTLYLRYINSGNDGNTQTFSVGSNLKVYDYLDSIYKVNIGNGSSGFSNNDTVVFVGALDITLQTNTAFTVGETIAQTGNTHFGIVLGTTSINDKTVLRIRPRTTDLSNTAIATTIWQFTDGADILGTTSGATATVNATVGSGAVGTVTTTADIGKVSKITMTDGGSGYYVAPYCSIKSSGPASAIGARNYTDLDLTAQNYIAQITVSSKTNTVGTGYAFGVTEGVIYQKGYFVRVEPQTVVVDKYSNTPDALSVGFDTAEDIIDSNIDQDLLDNAIGQPNEFAPGADRLKLTPFLKVLDTDTATANEEFLSLVDFSEGKPFREHRRTEFNSIEDEMALRTSEAAGDYVLNQFLVTTRSPANTSLEGQEFSVVVDPGRGYIDGYRVETIANFYQDADKGIDSRASANLAATIDYGNFIYVTEVAGAWDFDQGSVINLRTNPQHFVSNTSLVTSGTITISSSPSIGTARIRNFVWDSGEPGTPSAVYRAYLFNVAMEAGQNFKSVGCISVGSSGGANCIADVVKEFDATLNANVCIMHEANANSSLLIGTGTTATKNLSGLNYVYRMTAANVSIANTGSASYLLTDPTEYMGYESTSLTDVEKRTIQLVPNADILFKANTAADSTATVTSGSNTVTVSAAAVNRYQVGDFMVFNDTSTSFIRRVTGKSATTLQLDSNASFTNATSQFARALPKNVIVGLQRIPSATVTTSGGGKTINIDFGLAINNPSAITANMTFDVKVMGATPQAKTASRDTFVKLDLTTDNLNGPWCLGIPDIFRLKKVYMSSSSTVNTNSTDVTDQFYIDHNQTADYYGNGFLYKKTDANITLNGSTWLLVKFDSYTSSPGVFTINSYVSSNTAQRFADDSLPLASLGTKTNSFEVPELHTSKGKYYDLLNCIDFRPVCANTAAYAKTVGAATVNPSSTLTFSATDKKFPLPESGVKFDRESFLGRKDCVIITRDEQIKVVRGVPAVKPAAPKVGGGVLLLNRVVVPPYPCVAMNFSQTMKAILDKKMASEKFLLKRIRDKTIAVEIDAAERAFQQPKGYTMAEIGQLDRRITDLEYNVALSMVESDVKDKVIPSVVAPGLNRFKFGFYVDDYSTKKLSDIDSPEYACEVIDSKVVPRSKSIGTPLGPPDPAIGPCVQNIMIVDQGLASVTANVVANTTPNTSPNTTPSPAPSPTPTAKMVSLFQSEEADQLSANTDTGWITFSSVPSTYKIDYQFFDADEFYITKRNANGVVTPVYSNTAISNMGTLNFTHDPSTGREYRFVVHRNSAHFLYTLTYPIDDTVFVEASKPSTNNNTTFYDGTVAWIAPGWPPQAASLTRNFDQLIYTMNAGTVTLSLRGLKPSTIHEITVEDSSHTINATPRLIAPLTSAYLATDGLVTDRFGTIELEIVLNTNFLNQINSLTGVNGVSNMPPDAYIQFNSLDNTSKCAFVIRFGVPPEVQAQVDAGSVVLDGSARTPAVSPVGGLRTYRNLSNIV